MRISWNNGYKDVEVTDDSYRLRRIMGENKVTLKFSLAEFIEFPLGSFINYQGQEYTLNSPQTINEINSTHFEYTLVFGSHQDLLENYKLKDTQGRLKFPLTATPREHLGVLVNVLNTYNSGWSIGNCIENTEKLISYNHTNCYEALQMIANEFKTEWEVVGKTIHLRKVEYNKTNPITLSYGKGNGFVSGVGRNNDDQKAGFNVLYVQGGERNIDRSKYGSKELLLPKSKEYTYEGITYVTDAKGLFITQKGIAINNRKEESLDCSHIYPQRVGTVSEVIVEDAEKHFYDFKDSSIPADLDFSQCRMNGEKITIQFNSGMLSGREFEIQQEEDSMTGYVHAERRFKLVPKEEDGYTMPNATFKPEIGDKYAVFGMMMPNAYISDDTTKTGASWEMFKEACKHFYENHESKFTFKGTLDGIWAKKDWVNIGGKIRAGGFVSFSDAEFQKQGINIRIVSVKDFINNPHSPIIELANSVQGGSIVSELDKIRENEIVREDLHKRSLDFTKRRFRDAQETIAMLQEAQLDFGKSINPVTINTMGVLVGNQASQFVFVVSKAKPTEIEHNFIYDKTTKQLKAEAGTIKHISNTDILTMTNARTHKFWSVNSYISAVLDDATKSYYLYAKASKANETATFILSENPIKLEEVTGYYHLLVGVLNSEFEEQRSFVKLYGFSEYLPSQLKINRLTGQGLDINLLTGEIKGDVTFTSSSPALAQTKAITETAKQQAISTSALDATSKADIAKAQAEAKARELVDNIEVGGRNLVLKGDANISNDYYKIAAYKLSTNHEFKDGEEYTIYLRHSLGQGKVGIGIYNSSGHNVMGYLSVGATSATFKWRDVSSTGFAGNNNTYLYLYVYPSNVSSISKIEYITLVKGSKAMKDFVPAPEDIANERDEKIAQAKAESKTAWETYANLKSSNAQQSAIDTAKAYALAKDNEKETLIKAYADGKITTAEERAIGVATAKATLAETNAKAHADGKVTAEEQARILADTQKLAQAEAKAKELVDNIEVGGRNYLKNSHLEMTTTSLSSLNTYYGVYQYNLNATFRKLEGKRIVFSFDLKATKNGEIQFYCANGNPEFIFLTRISITTEYDRYSVSLIITRNGSNTGDCKLEFWGLSSGNKVSVKNVKLELGNKATDWTPAPEDVAKERDEKIAQAKAQLEAQDTAMKNKIATDLGYTSFSDFTTKASQGKTIVKGGVINTELINAVAVMAKYMQTTLLQANSIISQNGTRVQVNAQPNIPFEVYNSSGQRQVEFIEREGSVQMVFRNAAGSIIWYLGEKGIEYTQFTEAKWQSMALKSLGTNKSHISYSFLAGLDSTNGLFQTNILPSITYYRYTSATNAGTIVRPNEHNLVYKSHNYSSSNKIPDGYYCVGGYNSPLMMAFVDRDNNIVKNPEDVIAYQSGNTWLMIRIHKYTNGKLIESESFSCYFKGTNLQI